MKMHYETLVVRFFQLYGVLLLISLSSSLAYGQIDIRRVAYLDLNSLSLEPIEPEGECLLPFDGWQANGISRTNCAWHYLFGTPVPSFGSMTIGANQKANVAILSLDDIEGLKLQNPGLSYRFEIKVTGSWESTNALSERALYPAASCFSGQVKDGEVMTQYLKHFGDLNFWGTNISRARFPGFNKPFFQAKGAGASSFSWVHIFDFNPSECDAPFALKLKLINIKHLKFDFFEVNVYACTDNMNCVTFPNIF